jgi:UDP-N-acetylmuramate--alanine ligase
VAIVTNIDAEHLDHFGTFDAIKDAFHSFINSIPFYGFAVMCIDHPTVQDLVGRIEDRRIITYGENPQADVRLMDVDSRGGQNRFITRSTPPRRSRSRMNSASHRMRSARRSQASAA